MLWIEHQEKLQLTLSNSNIFDSVRIFIYRKGIIMDYTDSSGAYDKNKVLDGIADIEDEIQEMQTKDVIDKSRLTRLRYEQMLRGLYLWQNPYT